MNRGDCCVLLLVGFIPMLGASTYGDVYWGSISTNSGEPIMDWQFQNSVAKHLPSDVNGVFIGLGCHNAAFFDNLNSTIGDEEGGASYDEHAFSNFSSIAGNTPENVSFYDFFDSGVLDELKPGSTVQSLFDSGSANRQTESVPHPNDPNVILPPEAPQMQGQGNRVIEGSGGTNVGLIIFAPKPKTVDYDYFPKIKEVQDRFGANSDNLLITLAGDGANDGGSGALIDGDATGASLDNALEAMGDLVTNGDIDQVVILTLPHGNFEAAQISTSSIDPSSQQFASVTFPISALTTTIAEPLNDPTVAFYTSQSLTTSEEQSVFFVLNDAYSSGLAELNHSMIESPDGGTWSEYSTIVPKSALNPAGVQNFILGNFNSFPVTFDAIVVGTGDINQIVLVPEPSTAVLLILFTMASLTTVRWRRKLVNSESTGVS